MRHIKPMLAKLIDKPFDDNDWLFEIKFDGYRTIAEIESSGRVELYSRNGLSFNERFPLAVTAFDGYKRDAVFDGEMVVLDDDGRSRFQLLQNYQKTQEGNLVYYIFDLIRYDGKDLRSLPLLERKEMLKKVLPRSPRIKYSEHIIGQGIKFFEAAKKNQLEGIIGKKEDSAYLEGKRNGNWVKIKTHMEQEAVIAGFTKPLGGRKYFGALVLGVYAHGKLEYIGHTGGGFDHELLKDIYAKLKKLVQDKSPFLVPPKTNTPVTWVKPKMVCEVKFEEWTSEGQMRQPIFTGLRVDKPAKEVHRE